MTQENETARTHLNHLLKTMEQTENAESKKLELLRLRKTEKDLTSEMRKLRIKIKAEEKKVQVKHEEAISIEQRYRNMKEIVRHKKLDSEPKPTAYVDTEVVGDAEQEY